MCRNCLVGSLLVTKDAAFESARILAIATEFWFAGGWKSNGGFKKLLRMKFPQIHLLILLMEEILHQLIWQISHYLQGFIHPRCCRISSINSSMGYTPEDERLVHIIPFEVDASDHGFLSLKMGDGTVGVPFGVFILA